MQIHLDVDAKSAQSTLLVLLKTSAAKACPPFQVSKAVRLVHDLLLLVERLVDFEGFLLAILAVVVVA